MNAALWLYDNSIRIFPIKYRDKTPACSSWDDYIANRHEVRYYGNYGVVLGVLGVADSDSPESEAWVAANLPDTPFKVRTGRGRHRYYRLLRKVTNFIHRDGLTIEFRNAGQYVVGPGSTHASGLIYTPDDWSWDLNDIPFFPVNEFVWDDRPLGHRGSSEDGAPLILPEKIHAGERHDLMFKLMRSLQARGVTEIEWLLAVLRVENQAKCHPPIDEAELVKFITRRSKYHDKPGFERNDEPDEWELVGGLLELGATMDTAVAAAKGIDPNFNPLDIGDVSLDQLPNLPESQPSQPFISLGKQCPSEGGSGPSVHRMDTETPLDGHFPAPTGHPKSTQNLSQPDAQSDVSRPYLSCQKCQHSWRQHRKIPPRRCPACRTTLWDSGEHPVDEELKQALSFGREDDQVGDPNESEPINDPPLDEPEEDGPIYDPDTLEIVGETINGVTTWKDAK